MEMGNATDMTMGLPCTNELLDLILLKLPTRERVAAAAVCRSWASVAPRAYLYATTSLAVEHCNLRSTRRARRQRKLAAAKMAWATERSPYIRRLRLDMRPMAMKTVLADQRPLPATELLERLAAIGQLRAFWAEGITDAVALRDRCVTTAAACTHLTQLVLGHVSASLVADTLRQLPSLQELSLGYVRSRMLGNDDDSRLLDALSSLTQLRYVSIAAHGCSPRFAGSTHALAALRQLRHLHLCNFGFHELPHSIRGLAALTSLGLINREPVDSGWPGGAEAPADTIVPVGSLTRLTRLVHAQLDWRLQSVLPPCVTRLRLDASDQLCGPRRPAPLLLLHLLSPQLRALRRVSVIWPGLQPQAAALAMALDQLPALEHLALSQCELEVLPPLGCLSRCTALGLRCNELAELPPDLAAATRLQVLDLSFNPRLMRTLNNADAALLLSLPALRVLWMQPGTRRCSPAVVHMREVSTEAASAFVDSIVSDGAASPPPERCISSAAADGLGSAPPALNACLDSSSGGRSAASEVPAHSGSCSQVLGAAANRDIRPARVEAPGGSGRQQRRKRARAKRREHGSRNRAGEGAEAASSSTAQAAASQPQPCSDSGAAKAPPQPGGTLHEPPAGTRSAAGAALLPAGTEVQRPPPAIVWRMADVHVHMSTVVDDGGGSGLVFEDVCEVP